MSEATYHRVKEEIRKPESKVSKAHHGKTPADSNVSALKSIIDQNTDKAAEIEERKANLPLPEQPPVASDWQSLSQEGTGTGQGGSREGPIAGENNSALREPASVESSVRTAEGLKKDTQP
ncbi:hypothetical protein F5884DRAFT_795485 [Xylogone sp. PMI_703]|nr:hypothetical protein F5884DRAFT_795485 [Xylogone sp. PMI_703]